MFEKSGGLCLPSNSAVLGELKHMKKYIAALMKSLSTI